MSNPGLNIKNKIKDSINELLVSQGFENVQINSIDVTEEGVDLDIEVKGETTEARKKEVVKCVSVYIAGIQRGMELHTEIFKFVLENEDAGLDPDDLEDLLM